MMIDDWKSGKLSADDPWAKEALKRGLIQPRKPIETRSISPNPPEPGRNLAGPYLPGTRAFTKRVDEWQPPNPLTTKPSENYMYDVGAAAPIKGVGHFRDVSGLGDTAIRELSGAKNVPALKLTFSDGSAEIFTDSASGVHASIVNGMDLSKFDSAINVDRGWIKGGEYHGTPPLSMTGEQYKQTMNYKNAVGNRAVGLAKTEMWHGFEYPKTYKGFRLEGDPQNWGAVQYSQIDKGGNAAPITFYVKPGQDLETRLAEVLAKFGKKE